jgi:hypothetical protein
MRLLICANVAKPGPDECWREFKNIYIPTNKPLPVLNEQVIVEFPDCCYSGLVNAVDEKAHTYDAFITFQVEDGDD